jgi:hypothetical protein
MEKYKPFQKLTCVILKPNTRADCYDVRVKGDDTPAVLVCPDELLPGEEVVGLFGDDKEGWILLAIDEEFIKKRRAASKS